MKHPIRVLLVDDNVLLRKGLASLMDSQEDMLLVGEARDGCEALEKARGLKPDLILVGIGTPGSEELIRASGTSEEMRGVKIVIHASPDEDRQASETVAGGPQVHWARNGDSEQLFNLLRAV